MYESMKYSRGCYKLLNATGTIGCEAPNREEVTAPLVHLKDLPQMRGGPRVVVVPAEQLESLLAQYRADAGLRKDVVAILVDPTTARPAALSAATTFPNVEHALYSTPDYVWNPWGTGLDRTWLGLPLFMLTPLMANETAWRAAYNVEHGVKGGRHVARMQLPMDALDNSSRCISENTCLPVGSYGVWTALPALQHPLYVNITPRPTTLLLARMDSNSLFHDLTKASGCGKLQMALGVGRAGNAALSGLIAALAAIRLLASSGAVDTYTRQLAFAALPGEAFGHMGSKRLLYDMARNSSFTWGLRTDLVDQVVEVGQVGTAYNRTANASTFYLHTQRTGAYGNASALLDAAAAAGAAEDPLIEVSPASATNPGLPPSALTSFLRVRPDIAGMVIADFDQAFRSPYYESEYDDGFAVSLQSLADSTILVARTLHTLLAGPATPPLELNRTLVRLAVADLSVCLILESPGMQCPLAQALMRADVEVFYDGSTSAAVKGYPGVMRGVDRDPKSSRAKPNLARFVFNYLANATATPAPANASFPADNTTWLGAPCDTTVNLCPWPLACVGWRFGTKPDKDAATMGRCLNTTANYFPAYSTGLTYAIANGYWRWLLDGSAAAWEANYSWPADPMWTESNWPGRTPVLTVFQEESEKTQVTVLVVGLMLTLFTAVTSWIGVKAFEKHMKTQ
ncbi:hypothetical protein HYH03_004021 [Edaphochlamys debaryana]|uniref:Nicastrin n=1 Tax=Edaphochlamys debaryana TaxID=47281 RepID=A0A835YHJ0_9CHLO|nr:hypothetical protein HYH03_004021 [Edaphochlamys debaryana]|eukprot:KAG2497749.1 hypothetical protein HYH03_004021 [Edaphochlamys debaryana]